MGHYRRRARRYRYSYEAERSVSKRDQVSSSYGGIDSDIRTMFFGLDAFTLKLLFNRYEKDFEEGKRKYVEATYAKWKSGKVQMGGEISERLIKIVPIFLTFDQKYSLIQKLWGKLRSKTKISISISPDSDLNDVLEHIHELIATMGKAGLPAAVVERLDWLSQNDGQVAGELLRQVEDREIEIWNL